MPMKRSKNHFKSTSKSLLGALFLSGLCLLSACAPDGKSNPILGIWKTTALLNNGDDKTVFFNSPAPVWVEFLEDGTYVGGGGKLESDQGNYTISGDTILLESQSFVNKEEWLFKISGELMECTGTPKFKMENLKMKRKKVLEIPE